MGVQHMQIILLAKNLERESRSLTCSVMFSNTTSLSMIQNTEWKMLTEHAISFLELVMAKMKFSILSDTLTQSLISLMIRIWSPVQSVLNHNHVTGIQELTLLSTMAWTGIVQPTLKDSEKKFKSTGDESLQSSLFLTSSPRLALVTFTTQSMI